MILLALAVITATPATWPVAQINAVPGDKIVLAAGEYPAIRIRKRQWAPGITIDARKAKVAGIDLEDVSGVTIIGGTIRAPGGIDGFAAAGYAVRIVNASNVTFRTATVINARKGVVLSGGDGVTVRSVTFTGLREDGIIATSASNVTITGNRFADFRGLPRTCTIGGIAKPDTSGLTFAAAKAACEIEDGTYKDGSHQDAIQIYKGVRSFLISRNTITGDMQGITDFGSSGDPPVTLGRIEYNTIATASAHSISLTECLRCTIRFNVIQTLRPPSHSAPRRVPIRYNTDPAARSTACGNTVDAFSAGKDKVGMAPC